VAVFLLCSSRGLVIQKFWTPQERGRKFRPRYLDPKSLETPASPSPTSARILRMLDLDLGMFSDCLTVFEKRRVLLETIQSEDDQIDLLNHGSNSSNQGSVESLSPEQGEMELQLIEMTGIMKRSGIINRAVRLAERRSHREILREGWAG
jgi:hypothetical protein